MHYIISYFCTVRKKPLFYTVSMQQSIISRMSYAYGKYDNITYPTTKKVYADKNYPLPSLLRRGV